MKIGVIGLGHLGTVTAACLAEAGHWVLAYDPDYDAEIHPFRDDARDPGIAHLWAKGEQCGEIRAVHAPPTDCDLLWICFNVDTPEQYEPTIAKMRAPLAAMRPGTIVIISSPTPVGTVARLADQHPSLRFVCQPENLRIGRGLVGFKAPDRIVLGIEDAGLRAPLVELFRPFVVGGNGESLLFMSWRSAEMVKHGLNAFLAATVAFANEFGRLCAQHGANPADVVRGLKSDSRIGPRAYLAYGDPPGQHLSRDVDLLAGMAGGIFDAVKVSNESFTTGGIVR